MKNRPFAILLLILGLTAGLSACSDDSSDFEDWGENVDEAIDDTSRAIDDACEEIRDGVNADDTTC